MQHTAFLIFFLLYHAIPSLSQQKYFPPKSEESLPLSIPDSIIIEKKFSCIYVETEAKLENGHDDWNGFLLKNINYTVPCMNGAASGTYTVSVNFLISKEGLVTFIKSLTNHGYGMEDEVIKILSNSPKWNPATRNGRIISSLRLLLVTFKVSEPI